DFTSTYFGKLTTSASFDLFAQGIAVQVNLRQHRILHFDRLPSIGSHVNPYKPWSILNKIK
ncbi:MAG: hypothetical protein KKC86_08760, partial [Bacteroidetes bacterium]|nr:hypothetical protein [Bacteroidota bacterium]